MFAVGQAAIDLAPPQVKEFAIAAFGADDKTVLLGGILAVVALYAAVVGMLAVRRLAFGMWGLAIFAFIGLAAVLTRPTATAGYVVPTLVGTAAGAFALTWLARAAARLASPLDVLFPFDPPPELTDLAQPADPARPPRPNRPPDGLRRRTYLPCGPGLFRHVPASSGRPSTIPPATGASLAPGRIAVAGVAWAQHKGIAAVEVRLNGGPWHEARLATVPGIDTWRQWVWEWTASRLRPPPCLRVRCKPPARPSYQLVNRCRSGLYPA